MTTHRRRPMSSRTVHRAREAFLDGLRQGWSVSRSAELAGWSRQAAYVERNTNLQFAAAWDDAHACGEDALLDEARRRAIDGVETLVIQSGKIVRDAEGNPLTTRQFSDRLLELLLKIRCLTPRAEAPAPEIPEARRNALIEKLQALAALGAEPESSPVIEGQVVASSDAESDAPPPFAVEEGFTLGGRIG